MDASASTTGLPDILSNFSNIIGIILNNWTAIKLAIDHGMAGTPAACERKLMMLCEVVSTYLASGKSDWFDLSDLLSDVLDSEFGTVLEDNSSDEVAAHLCELYQMYLKGDAQSLIVEINKLSCQTPIFNNQAVQKVYPHHNVSEVNQETEATDSDGWTTVKKHK